ncbi:MAG: hypothetical protein A2Z35_06135 [Actinobacteria bacterium RBG_19FT_COMBO_36_27]|nr:MAG: hypothetical protein A2Z35_06135 [Actinobacteria bacterium RBG_19FT_COMBO_36_27]
MKLEQTWKIEETIYEPKYHDFKSVYLARLKGRLLESVKDIFNGQYVPWLVFKEKPCKQLGGLCVRDVVIIEMNLYLYKPKSETPEELEIRKQILYKNGFEFVDQILEKLRIDDIILRKI